MKPWSSSSSCITEKNNKGYIQQGEGTGILASARNQPTKIEAVYLAVIEFIKWYNRNEKDLGNIGSNTNELASIEYGIPKFVRSQVE